MEISRRSNDGPVSGMPLGDKLVDVVVVGAGVVGTAVARILSHQQLSVVLLEAGRDVGAATSKANTAILHTGFDATPGTLESRLVARGSTLLREYAPATGVSVEETGALLVAWDREQRSRLPGFVDKAVLNGYDACRLVDVDELYRLEPFLGTGALGALHVPDEHIIDPWSVSLAFATDAVANGCELRRQSPVTSLTRTPAGWSVATPTGAIECSWLVNAAGLHGDTIDGWVLGEPSFTIRPRRGELIVFDELARPLNNNVFLPVPTPTTNGVLVSPTVFGNVMLGPTADDIDDREATATTADGLSRLQVAGRRIVPKLLDEEVTSTYAGLRPATDQRDYQISLHVDHHYLALGGIRSTGLTSAMGIAEYALELLRDGGLNAQSKESTMAVTVPSLGQSAVRPWTTGAPIICHCERVTMGEVQAACRGPVPALNLDGVRRRTRALLGRCQGFNCLAEITAACPW